MINEYFIFIYFRPYLTHIVSILESIFINQKDYKPMVLLNSLRVILYKFNEISNLISL